MPQPQRTHRKRRRRLNPLFIVTLFLMAALIAAVVFLISLFSGSTANLTIEAGSPLPDASFFFNGEGENVSYLSDTSGINTSVPGQYDLEIMKDGTKVSAVLIVQDTVAPTATAKEVSADPSSSVKPEDFVQDIVDGSKVTVAFEKEPDMNAAGDQQVVIILTDAAGNTTKLSATLRIVTDTVAPQIQGVKNIVTYAGDTVAYRNGITVTDDHDTAPKLTIDSSAVDLSTPGTYKVTYTATDAAGNTVSQEATVEVLVKQANHVPVEQIYERVDAILAQFITDDMTDLEKAAAIYVWTHRGDHLIYGSAPDRTDYLQTAYEFLDTKKGDCFWFFAIQKLMFERVGIPTIDVKKVKNFEGDSNHYWLLVSVDQGKTYYHFDNVWSRQLFLVTDAKLNSFSKACNNCFNRDESLYPATPTTEAPKTTIPWNSQAIKNAKP